MCVLYQHRSSRFQYFFFSFAFTALLNEIEKGKAERRMRFGKSARGERKSLVRRTSVGDL